MNHQSPNTHIDAESRLTDMLSQELSKEIDREILSDIFRVELIEETKKKIINKRRTNRIDRILNGK